MASYHHLLEHKNPRFESPAKVFAKLKSKLQREGTCASEGIFTGKGPLCNITDKHGAELKSPKKRTENIWTTGELKENQRFSFYRDEAQAVTLSPISSPQKTFGYSYSDISSKPAEFMPPATERGHGCTPRKRDFLESTAVSQPLFLVNRKQIHTEPPEIRDLAGFTVTGRTPVKIQSTESDCVFEHECAPVVSSVVFSPMKKRLRKTKLEPWGFNNVSSSTRDVGSEVISQPQERKTSRTFCEDDIHNNPCMEDLVHVRGRSDMNRFTHEPVVPTPRATAKNRCGLITDKVLPMSPAKMFAYMKERESKSEQQEVHNVSSSMRDLFDRGNIRLSRDTPLTVHSVGETEDSNLTSAPESVVPDNKSRVEPADSQSDTDPSEDVLTPAAPSQPLLFEDPLILNSPRISLPKKDMTVLKSNKWPQAVKFPSESVIYLKKWFLRRNPKGLFVDGIHRENNIPWNSNIIMDRISNYVLKTISGRVYILVGKMNLHVDSEFPKWLLKKFLNGFPPNWKALYDNFMLESREETKRKSEGRKTKSEASSINLSVKRHMKKPLKTPDACPPASSSSTKVSRSGRIIKPPLEYWKGGRVILDAHMNVTIHECYDTSICNPEVTTTVSARASQKPAHVFLPCSEGRKQGESASVNEVSVPQRKVKAPARRRDRNRVIPEEKSSFLPVSTVETCSSPEEWSGRRTRSSQRYPGTERSLHMETVPQKQQSEPEKPSTRTSKEQRCDTTRPSVRASRSKRASASPESATGSDKTSPDQASSNDLVVRRKKRVKGGHRHTGEKSQRGHLSEESGNELRKRTSVTKNKDLAQTKHKQSKCTKTSQPAKLLPKTQSSKKHKADKGNTQIPQEQDEDEWTEAELAKLTEAVALCPKHITGYWAKVARMVGTRSAEECCNQHTSQGTSQSPAKRTKKPRQKKDEAPMDSDHPVISARVGTLKRKQQVRQFLENMPKEDVDDLFSCAHMQNKRFEIPSVCLSEDHDFSMSDLEPMTPMSTGFPKVKTPQCLHLTPSMMGSPNRSNDDKYVYQLQKRMKKSEFDVCKKAATSKSFTPTPSVKRTMRRCGNTENDTFVVWEMFPGNNGALSESGEEEDFYFSHND